MLWVWYYHRQGVIQSDGISIIVDFPRYLVLLPVFQCFGLDIPALKHDDDDHEGPTLQALSPITEIDLNTLEIRTA